MKEVWKPVPYEPFDKAYSVSSLGRVKPNVPSRYSKNKAEVLKPMPGTRGYLHVTLYFGGKQRSCFVHRMVALAFHGPPPFDGAMVEHLNDIQTDNRADNLKWGTHQSNTATREAIGKTSRGVGNGRALLSENDVRAIRALHTQGGISQAALGKQFGVDQTVISKIVRRISWRHLE